MSGNHSPADDKLTVRRANPDDADAISLCLAAAFEEFRSAYTPEAFEDTVVTPVGVRQRMTYMSVYVATDGGGNVVGTVASSLAGDTGHLRGMAVHPEWRSRGIAQSLLDQAESDLIAAGCARLTLDTTLPLEPAIRFYRRNGFTASGCVSDYFAMPLHEYEKRLDAAPTGCCT